MTSITVIDIETTGLNPSYAKVVEIGAVKIGSANSIVSRFQTLVWPGEEAFKLPGVDDALRIQGRKMEDFMGGLSTQRAAIVLAQFVGHDRVLSYNSEFDRKFLWFSRPDDWAECIMINSSNIMGEAGSPYCPWNDYHGNYKWPKLREAAKFFNVPCSMKSSHSALYDAEVAAHIFLKQLIYVAGKEQEYADRMGEE